MKKLTFLLCALFLVFNAYSAYLRNVPVELKQPDGTIINCFTTGDEFHRRVHDTDNYTILQDPTTGYYVYAIKDGEVIKPSSYIVGKSDPKVLQLVPNVDIPAQQTVEESMIKLKSAEIVPETPTKGNFNNIVISVRFSDQSPTNLTLQDYEDRFNSITNFSLKSYYNEVSNFQLNINSNFFPTPIGQTILEYQDSHPRAYYSYFNEINNPIGYKDNERFEREIALLKNAIEFVENQIISSSINFDLNMDGYVDNIMFVIQGVQDNWGGILWPQTSSLPSSVANIGNKSVNYVNKLLTLSLNPSIICHEFFHSLGAPDLYRSTNTNSYEPIGPWDIMALNGDQSPSVYMKCKYGKWVENIAEITQAGSYSLMPVTSSPYAAFKIASPNNSDEYFMVEYRKRGQIIDQSLPGEGLIVYRINKNMYGKGNLDGPPEPDEVYIYRPGGTSQTNGEIKDANFSKDHNRSEFNDLTDPSCFLSNGQLGGIQIHNIRTVEDEVFFDVSFNSSLIKVKSPNGNESWQVGTAKEISWTSLNVDKVNVDYSLDGGQSWSNLANDVGNDLNKLLWELPVQLTSDAIVKVSDTNNSLISDCSDKTFIIRNENYITEVEVNNSFSTANILEIGDSVKGILSYPTDYDYYKFYIDSAGSILDISIRYDNLADNGGTSKSIFIYDANLEYTYPYSYSNRLTKTFDKAGWYYIKFFCGGPLISPYWLRLNRNKLSAPTIDYFEPCNIYPTSSNFWAIVRTNNIKTNYSFHYAEYDSRGGTPPDSVHFLNQVEAKNNPYSSNNELSLISLPATNLKPNTGYICRLRAQNELGTFWSLGGFQFKTPMPPDGWERQNMNDSNDISSISFYDEKNGMLVLTIGPNRGNIETNFTVLSSFQRTDNIGLNWEYQYKQEPPSCFFPLQGVYMVNKDIALGYALGAIFSKDCGKSWAFVNTDLPLINFRCATSSNADTWYLGGNIANKIGEIGTDVGVVLKTIDGGDNWEAIKQDFDASVISLTFKDDNNGMLVTADKKIYRTMNGGENWQVIFEGQDFNPMKLVFINKNWIVAGYDGIIYSSDMGESWKRAEIDMGNWNRLFGGRKAYLTCIAFTDSLNGIAGGKQGVILRTKDGGKDWYFEESGTDNNIMDVAFKGTVAWACGESGLLLRKEIDLSPAVYPLANAGSDLTIPEGTTVTIDGSDSRDPENNLLTYHWTLVKPLTPAENFPIGPEVVLKYSPNGLETKTINVKEETKIFLTFSASDDKTHIFKFTDKALESIFIMFSKSEGDKSAVFPAPPVGIYEYTIDNTETGYMIIESSVLSSAFVSKPIFEAPEVKKDTTFIFTLVVNNGKVDSPTDQMAITIKNINQPPIAITGINQTLNEGAIVTLDGSASTDPDGDPLIYQWNSPSEVTFSSTTSAKPTFTAPEVKQDSTLNFSLLVNDGAVNSLPATVKVNVLNVTNVGVPTMESPLFKIFPNPTAGIINLEISGNTHKKNEVLITNLVGDEIFRKEVNDADKFQIDLSNQVNGIYLIKMTIGNQQYIHKIVVRKE